MSNCDTSNKYLKSLKERFPELKNLSTFDILKILDRNAKRDENTYEKEVLLVEKIQKLVKKYHPKE